MRFYLHDRNNVPEREKITYYSNAEGDLIKEDLPQNLKSAKETLFREGSGGHEFLVTFMGKEYISIENSFSSDNQEYLNLDFEPHTVNVKNTIIRTENQPIFRGKVIRRKLFDHVLCGRSRRLFLAGIGRVC